MTSGTLWNLFYETGDIEYYLLFKESGGAREKRAVSESAAPACQNTDDIKTAV